MVWRYTLIQSFSICKEIKPARCAVVAECLLRCDGSFILN